MDFSLQKSLAGKVRGISPSRIKLDSNRFDEIKEAITKEDIRALLRDGAIVVRPSRSTSRGRARENHLQRVSGRQRGVGSRKGRKGGRLDSKGVWMNTIRLQRSFLALLKEKGFLTNEVYSGLYRKSKGGFFRSKRHIQLYIEEHKLVRKN